MSFDENQHARARDGRFATMDEGRSNPGQVDLSDDLDLSGVAGREKLIERYTSDRCEALASRLTQRGWPVGLCAVVDEDEELVSWVHAFTWAQDREGNLMALDITGAHDVGTFDATWDFMLTDEAMEQEGEAVLMGGDKADTYFSGLDHGTVTDEDETVARDLHQWALDHQLRPADPTLLA